MFRRAGLCYTTTVSACRLQRKGKRNEAQVFPSCGAVSGAHGGSGTFAAPVPALPAGGGGRRRGAADRIPVCSAAACVRGAAAVGGFGRGAAHHGLPSHRRGRVHLLFRASLAVRGVPGFIRCRGIGGAGMDETKTIIRRPSWRKKSETVRSAGSLSRY